MCSVPLLGGIFIVHTHVDVCRRSDVCSAAVEKEKRTQTELFICFSCRVFRIVYASRWPEMTTNRSSYIRPAFWKVPGYVCDVPMTVATPTAPTSSRLTQRRRSSNSGIKKRVHFADELYSGVSQATSTADQSPHMRAVRLVNRHSSFCRVWPQFPLLLRRPKSVQ